MSFENLVIAHQKTLLLARRGVEHISGDQLDLLYDVTLAELEAINDLTTIYEKLVKDIIKERRHRSVIIEDDLQ